MLVLTRLKEEAIMIGHDIEVKVLEIRGDRVRLGIVAPSSVAVHRKEVYLNIQRENLESSRSRPENVDEAKRLMEKGEEPGEKRS
jgi:carbon storage regulator